MNIIGRNVSGGWAVAHIADAMGHPRTDVRRSVVLRDVGCDYEYTLVVRAGDEACAEGHAEQYPACGVVLV